MVAYPLKTKYNTISESRVPNTFVFDDYTPDEIRYLIDLSADLKAKKKSGVAHDTLKGKNIALIFEKTSTRTRCAL